MKARLFQAWFGATGFSWRAMVGRRRLGFVVVGSKGGLPSWRYGRHRELAHAWLRRCD